MTTRADLERLSRGLDEATRRAVAALDAAIGHLDLSRPEIVRDALLEAFPAIVSRYGDVAATLAAEWYEQMRAEAASGSYGAVLADGPSYEQTARTVRWAAGGLWGPDPSGVPGLLQEALARYVGWQGKSTVTTNVAADPARPRWARVPGRGGCCAWCAMLASRGFVYESSKTAGEGHPYHAHCSCVPTPLWRGQAGRIDGYHPGRLRAVYSRARAAVKAAGGPLDDKTIAAEMRRIDPDSFTDGIHSDE